MKKIIIIVLVGFIALIGIAVGGAMFMTSGAASTGDTFMTALKEGNYAKAFEQCTPDLQKELGSADKIKEVIESQDVKPLSYSFSSRNVVNNEAKLEGAATLSNNREANAVVSLSKIGNDWKVMGFSIKAK